MAGVLFLARRTWRLAVEKSLHRLRLPKAGGETAGNEAIARNAHRPTGLRRELLQIISSELCFAGGVHFDTSCSRKIIRRCNGLTSVIAIRVALSSKHI